jgi:hypothetical protein
MSTDPKIQNYKTSKNRTAEIKPEEKNRSQSSWGETSARDKIRASSNERLEICRDS